MAHDAQGRLWVAEWGADRIARLDGRGKRAEVIRGISQPAGLAFDDDGTLWAAGYGDGRIYAWTPATGLRVVAQGLSAPTGLFWSAETGLLAASRNAGEVVRIKPDGTRQVVSSGHRLPVGVTRLADGSLAVSCYGGSVDIVAPDRAVRSIPATAAGLARPGVGILAAGPDSVLVADNGGGAVARLDRGGRATALASGLASPVGLARAPDGRVLVAIWGDGTVRAPRGKDFKKEKTMDNERYTRGLALLERIDGPRGEAVLRELAGIAPDFARHLVEFPFGDIMGRPGLDLKSRELVTVAALTALGHARPQLLVHLAAALRVGCTRAELVETCMQMAVYAGFPAALNALFAAREVFSAQES